MNEAPESESFDRARRLALEGGTRTYPRTTHARRVLHTPRGGVARSEQLDEKCPTRARCCWTCALSRPGRGGVAAPRGPWSRRASCETISETNVASVGRPTRPAATGYESNASPAHKSKPICKSPRAAFGATVLHAVAGARRTRTFCRLGGGARTRRHARSGTGSRPTGRPAVSFRRAPRRRVLAAADASRRRGDARVIRRGDRKARAPHRLRPNGGGRAPATGSGTRVARLSRLLRPPRVPDAAAAGAGTSRTVHYTEGEATLRAERRRSVLSAAHAARERKKREYAAKKPRRWLEPRTLQAARRDRWPPCACSRRRRRTRRQGEEAWLAGGRRRRTGAPLSRGALAEPRPDELVQYGDPPWWRRALPAGCGDGALGRCRREASTCRVRGERAMGAAAGALENATRTRRVMDARRVSARAAWRRTRVLIRPNRCSSHAVLPTPTIAAPRCPAVYTPCPRRGSKRAPRRRLPPGSAACYGRVHRRRRPPRGAFSRGRANGASAR